MTTGRKNRYSTSARKNQPRLTTRFRRYLQTAFLTGILVVGPIIATYLVLKVLIGLTDSFLNIIPKAYQPETLFGFHIPFLGTMLAVVTVLVVGVFTRNLVGRKIVNIGERIIQRIPIARSIYSAVKQFMTTLFVKNRDNFQRVVLIQYPRIGIWSMAFVTGRPSSRYLPPGEGSFLSLFVPTTPNPTSGFYLMVPEEETISLKITVEEAFRAIISAGITTGDSVKNQSENDYPE